MDLWGVEKGLVGVHGEHGRGPKLHPDRFVPSISVDANKGMEVRARHRGLRDLEHQGSACSPAGMFPQVPINDKKMYPVYARAELGIAVACAPASRRCRSPASTSS